MVSLQVWAKLANFFFFWRRNANFVMSLTAFV